MVPDESVVTVSYQAAGKGARLAYSLVSSLSGRREDSLAGCNGGAQGWLFESI